MYTLNEILLANGVILLATMVQTSVGMGFAMIAVPLLALINLDLVPGTSLFINLFLAVFMLRDGRSNIVRKEIAVLLPSIAVGTLAAMLLLLWISETQLTILFSSMILLAAAITVFIHNTGLTTKKMTVGGFTSGLMGTVSGIHGSPLAVLYQHEKIAKVRATLALVFVFAYSLSLLALSYTGAFGLQMALESLVLFPALIAGFFLAKQVRNLISASMARYLILTIAVTGAILLLVKVININ